MEKKVTITITETGWETKVELEGKTYIEKHERTSSGAKGVEGNFEQTDLPDELVEQITTGSASYDIMRALAEI